MTRGGPPQPTQTHPPYGTMMVVLLVSSSSAVVYSHYYAQRRDKAIMRAGVERD
jgi:heme/copper-type cytochrome/quinol oxidase subunit 3